MRKTVLTFGLIAGAILSAMMWITLSAHDSIGFDRGEVIGYTTMVLAFLMIYFGVRSYRDTVAGGTIRFGRAFVVGALIALVASACYVATWEVIYYKMAPDYLTKYREHVLASARANGASDQALAEKRAELEQFARLYQNPVVNVAFTMLEPLPVALVIALISAGVLSRRRRDAAPDTLVASAGASS